MQEVFPGHINIKYKKSIIDCQKPKKKDKKYDCFSSEIDMVKIFYFKEIK